MSFIRKVSREHNAAKPPAAPQNLNQPNFFVEMAPAMVPTHEFDLNVWNNQMAVITKLQQKYSDLPNKMETANTHSPHSSPTSPMLNT